jgi:SPP1 family predicted phage head-tail adaptor
MSIIARLRHRLTLEAPQETPDGTGGVTRNWIALAQLWAAIEPLGAGDSIIADKRVARLTHRVMLRKRNDLSLNHRFRFGARSFAIRTLRDAAEDGRFLECLVEEERS